MKLRENLKPRIIIIGIAISFIFIFLILRLWQLQIIEQDIFKERALRNRTRLRLIEPPRGIIYDRNGNIIVSNTSSFYISIIPAEIYRDLDKTSSLLEDILHISKEDLKDKIRKRGRYSYKVFLLKDKLSINEVINLKEHQDELSGVIIGIKPKRKYIYKHLASHIIGYTGLISLEELKERKDDPYGYRGDDVIGKSGVEKSFEEKLRGKKGWEEVEVNTFGRVVEIIERKDPEIGHPLYLSIDIKLQSFAESLLKGKRGVIIISNPKTFEILAMASSPDYNPEIFIDTKVHKKEWIDTMKNPAHPLTNRAIQGMYPPGSIFKLITAIGALEEGWNPNKEIYCGGVMKIAGRNFYCWKRSGHGDLNLIEGIENSCNIQFYTLGGYLGPNKLYKYAKLFGLGEKTGIALPNEKKGLLPNPTWKKKRLKEIWYPGDTANMSIGQGFTLVTPLQILNLVNIIINNGKVYVPQIIKTDKPKLKRKINIEKKNFEIVKRGMKLVVERGTARASKLKEISYAGKTGTAQNPHGEPHSWFAGFAPYKDPEISFVVLVENGGEGSEAAAPIAKEIVKKYFGIVEEEDEEKKN